MQNTLALFKHLSAMRIMALYRRLCCSWGAPGVYSAQRMGALAEQQAANYLVQQGLTIVARNLRRRCGEIDLYCQEGMLAVFVEVRYRGLGAWQDAGCSIDHVKRRKILRVARQLMREQSLLQVRIDAVLIDEGKPIRWVRDAVRF